MLKYELWKVNKLLLWVRCVEKWCDIEGGVIIVDMPLVCHLLLLSFAMGPMALCVWQLLSWPWSICYWSTRVRQHNIWLWGMIVGKTLQITSITNFNGLSVILLRNHLCYDLGKATRNYDTWEHVVVYKPIWTFLKSYWNILETQLARQSYS